MPMKLFDTYRCNVQCAASLEQDVHIRGLDLARADEDLVGEHQRKQQLVPLKQAALQHNSIAESELGCCMSLRCRASATQDNQSLPCSHTQLPLRHGCPVDQAALSRTWMYK